jgi:hypothetical protein
MNRVWSDISRRAHGCLLLTENVGKNPPQKLVIDTYVAAIKDARDDCDEGCECVIRGRLPRMDDATCLGCRSPRSLDGESTGKFDPVGRKAMGTMAMVDGTWCATLETQADLGVVRHITIQTKWDVYADFGQREWRSSGK